MENGWWFSDAQFQLAKEEKDRWSYDAAAILKALWDVSS